MNYLGKYFFLFVLLVLVHFFVILVSLLRCYTRIELDYNHNSRELKSYRREVGSFLANKLIFHLWWNSNVHYRAHKTCCETLY